MSQVIIVNSPGPQGPVGPQGPIGPTGPTSSLSINTGSFVTTSSFNLFTGSYNTGSFTGSFTGLITSASYAVTASYALNSVASINSSSFATTGSNTFIGTQTITGSLILTGSLIGQPLALATASGTASLDCSRGNFFTLALSSSYTMFLSASNIQPGQTVNLRITQPATSGSLRYSTQFKFAGGIPYSASATGSAVDIVSFISFDSSILYGSAIKNLS